nr:hypothetical protein [Proteiniphilum sp.]
PPEWEQYHVTRRYRGVTYRITVNNPEKRMKGVKAITLNGEQVKGNLVPLQPVGSECKVEVIL